MGSHTSTTQLLSTLLLRTTKCSRCPAEFPCQQTNVMFAFSVTHQTMLCVSNKANKHDECNCVDYNVRRVLPQQRSTHISFLNLNMTKKWEEQHKFILNAVSEVFILIKWLKLKSVKEGFIVILKKDNVTAIIPTEFYLCNTMYWFDNKNILAVSHW